MLIVLKDSPKIKLSNQAPKKPRWQRPQCKLNSRPQNSRTQTNRWRHKCYVHYFTVKIAVGAQKIICSNMYPYSKVSKIVRSSGSSCAFSLRNIFWGIYQKCFAAYGLREEQRLKSYSIYSQILWQWPVSELGESFPALFSWVPVALFSHAGLPLQPSDKDWQLRASTTERITGDYAPRQRPEHKQTQPFM